MKWFRRGRHHRTKFSVSVDEIKAGMQPWELEPDKWMVWPPPNRHTARTWPSPRRGRPSIPRRQHLVPAPCGHARVGAGIAMTNVNDLPNHVALHNDVTIGFSFGAIHSVTAINLPGNGHRPHIRVRYRGGLAVDYDPATATELARRLPEALAFMPTVPDCSGAVVDLGEAL